LPREHTVAACCPRTMGLCGCCSGGEKDGPPEPETFFFKKRGCTDCLCLLIFIAFWGGMGYITYLSATVGEPMAVLYGKDYLGNRCGQGTMASKPKTYYPRIDQDLIAQSAIATTMPWRLVFYGLCLEDCPNVTTPQACFNDPSQCSVADYGTPAEYGAAGGSASYFATMPSLDVMNRCVPIDSNSLTQAPDRCAFPQCDGVTYAPCDAEYPQTWTMTFPQSLNCKVVFRVGEIQQMRPMTVSTFSNAIGKYTAVGSTIVKSITTAYVEILCFGLAMPIVLGFCFLVLLRFAAGIMTYVMIILIAALLVLLTLYLYLRAGAINALLTTLSSNSTTLPITPTNETAEIAAWANDTLAQALGLVNSAESAIASIAPSSLSADMAAVSNEVPALWWILAVIMTIITLVYVIAMCSMRKQIKTAIALTKVGTAVIRDRPMMMFFPFNNLVVQLLFFFYFVLIIMFLQTASLTASHFSELSSAVKASTSFVQSIAWMNSTINSGGVSQLTALDNSSLLVNVIVYIYFVFGFLWTLECFTNITFMAMSGATSHWFFFREDPSARTKAPLLRSLWRTFRYHLGTIAFGSFIIAVVQLIRIFLMLLDKYTKKQQQSNLLIKLTIKCAQCCLWCLEKTLKFITNYCYIYTAMQGSGFCKSCFLTFSLIVTNPGQLAINTFVRTILSWIQIIGVPVASGWVCNLVLVNVTQRTETIWPTVVVAISAYIVAKTFSLVFACVLDTLFVCACRDKADYKGKYMPDRLKSVFGFKKRGKNKKKDEEEDGETEKAGAKGDEVEAKP